MGDKMLRKVLLSRPTSEMPLKINSSDWGQNPQSSVELQLWLGLATNGIPGKSKMWLGRTQIFPGNTLTGYFSVRPIDKNDTIKIREEVMNSSVTRDTSYFFPENDRLWIRYPCWNWREESSWWGAESCCVWQREPTANWAEHRAIQSFCWEEHEALTVNCRSMWKTLRQMNLL